MTELTHAFLAAACYDSYHNVSVNTRECECWITKEKDFQVVAFRGTEVNSLFAGLGVVDVITDIRVIPWKDKDTGWFHSGFLSGGKASAKAIAPLLDKTIPLYLTGHSLGGAVSLACAVKLKSLGFNVVEWVGFGSPKARIFRLKEYEFECTNYRNNADAVPLKPRWIGYKHGYKVIRTNVEDKNRRPTWDDHAISLYQLLDGYIK